MNNNGFDETKYTRINGFLDMTTTEIISLYMENKIRLGEWIQGSEKDPTTQYSYYADPLMEALLLKCKDKVEQITGKELLPTYSYSRIYQPAEQLEVHVDRKACEISVTVSVATRGESSPFYTKYGNNETIEHKLNPGDAIVYMGCDVDHWRTPLEEGQLVVQFMLHYVDKNGLYAKLENDTRPALGFCLSVKKQIEED